MKETDDFTPDVPIKQLMRRQTTNPTQQKPTVTNANRYDRYRRVRAKRKPKQ